MGDLRWLNGLVVPIVQSDIEELRDIDIDNLTPLKALLLLEQLKRKASLDD